MTGHRDPSYRCEPMGGLMRQLLYAPPDKRVLQVRRAEALYDQIEPDGEYPLDFVHFKITGYRREGVGETLVSGSDLMADLCVLIDQLSRSSPVEVIDSEPVETTGTLAKRLGVSTKTIIRWRAMGLRWRWVVKPGSKRRQIGYTGAAVKGFLDRNPQRVDRAHRFTQLDPQQRDYVIGQARRLADEGLNLNQVAKQLAEQLGRVHQTMRVILEKYDKEHPEDRIFEERRGPVAAVERGVIVRAYRRGESAQSIAERFGRDKALVYRAVRLRRAAVLKRLPIRYVSLSVFDREDADEVILREEQSDPPSPSEVIGAKTGLLADELPEPLDRMFGGRQLGGEQVDQQLQKSMLIRFNYLKYLAVQSRDGLDSYNPGAKRLKEIETYVRRAGAIRDWVFIGSLPEVLSVARRDLLGQEDQSVARLIELLLVGVDTLGAAIGEYNPGRNQVFSEYLKSRLMQVYAADRSKEGDEHLRARKKVNGPLEYRRIQKVASRWGIRILI